MSSLRTFSSISAKISLTAAALVSETRLEWLRAASARNRVVASPKAQRTPGELGTITGQEFINLAIAFECNEPAPPKPINAKSRGSYPCCTEIMRSAPKIFSLTISMMPAAASCRPIPNASATSWTAFFAASLSSLNSPPNSDSGR